MPDLGPRLGVGVRQDLKAGINKFRELSFGECSNFGLYGVAIFEDNQRGDATNTEFLGDGWIGIYVYFAHFESARVLTGDFIEHWSDHFAGSAPFGPKIHKNGFVGLQNIV